MLDASDGASIIAISTTAAIEHFMGGVDAYSTIKAGLIKLMADYAQALGPKGIRANTISPGPIFVEGGGWDHIRNNMEDFYNATIANEPLGRIGTAEVANVAAFLASPAASLGYRHQHRGRWRLHQGRTLLAAFNRTSPDKPGG